MAQIRGIYTDSALRSRLSNVIKNGYSADAYRRAQEAESPPSKTSSYIPPTTTKLSVGFTPDPDPALDPYGTDDYSKFVFNAPAQAQPAATQATASSSGGGYSAPITPVAPAIPAAPATPTYDGMSTDEYRETLVKQVTSGIMSAWEANQAIIRNNLTKALSELDAEKAALDPLYQKQLKAIKDNEFATRLKQTELMNQSGWNTANSGLAVGEHTKISMQADEQTAEATAGFNQQVADIMRRRTLAQGLADTDLSAAEKQKNLEVAEAEAMSMIQAEERNRQIYESDRAFAESTRQWQANYNLDAAKFQAQQNQYWQDRADSLAAAAAKGEEEDVFNGFEDWEIDELTTTTFSEIVGSKDPNATLQEILADDELPAAVKENLLNLMQKNKTLNSTGSTSGINLATSTSLSSPTKKSGQVT